MMKKWSLTRVIATAGCIIAAASAAVFMVLLSDRTGESFTEAEYPFENARMITPKTYGSYGELMFAYIGEHNYIYNLDDESVPLVYQPAKELLYASDDSVLYTASCEMDHTHPGRESIIQELQTGEQENRLHTIARVTVDPCWSSNDEVIYYVEDQAPKQLCTFEPLTSTSEAAATFEEEITGLRISSDGLLVTLADGNELLYVPLSKQLTEPGISARGQMITVCEQYDLLLSPEGRLSYHWQGSDETVTIAEGVINGISHQDNEIYYLQQTAEGTALMSFIVSEEQHHRLTSLDSSILPQLTADADYAFVVSEQGIVYRYDIQQGSLIPFCFIDPDTVRAPLISLFDYRLMIYDLHREADDCFCYAVPAHIILSDETIGQNTERAEDILADASDAVQFPELRFLSMGSTGESVLELQRIFTAHGYMNQEPTGIFDVATMQATAAAQADLELKETGCADRLFQVLFAESDASNQLHDIVRGDDGTRVRDVRARLTTLGYMLPSPAGQCDDAMIHAVELYCARSGIAFSGTITEEIQQSLFEKEAPGFDGFLDLKAGDTGEACYRLNERLRALG